DPVNKRKMMDGWKASSKLSEMVPDREKKGRDLYLALFANSRYSLKDHYKEDIKLKNKVYQFLTKYYTSELTTSDPQFRSSKEKGIEGPKVTKEDPRENPKGTIEELADS